jgi:hypothetical protein
MRGELSEQCLVIASDQRERGNLTPVSLKEATQAIPQSPRRANEHGSPLMSPRPQLGERVRVRGISPNQRRTDSTGGLGSAEYSLMSERMRKRKACDGPLGCEKPPRAVLFPRNPGHATPFASPLQPVSSKTATTSGPSKSS